MYADNYESPILKKLVLDYARIWLKYLIIFSSISSLNIFPNF